MRQTVKSVVKAIGVIMLVAGILVVLVGNAGAKEAQGGKLTVGYVQNSDFVATNSGSIGRSAEKIADMKAISGFGYVGVALGVGLILVSTRIEEEY